MLNYIKQNRHLTIAFSVYAILWIFTAYFLIHGINPDSVSYFLISKEYFDGHFYEAINAYWGPLFSWLILPSFVLKIEPHIFARILFGIFSIFFFILINNFFSRVNLNDKIKSLGIYFFILPAIFFSFYRLTPDYLLLLLTLIYVYITSKEDFWLTKSFVLLSSVLGVFMFLTKSYGLMFFVAFQTFLLIIEFFSNKKISRALIFNYFLSLIVFFLIISPWIYLLSNKYGSFTISTSGTVNIRIVNPELNFRHPSIESGFVAPSDNYSISAWDDPNLNAYPEWSPFSSFKNFKYFILNAAKNIIKLFIFIFAFAPFLIFAIILIKKNLFLNKTFLIILTAGLIYGLGYTPIYVENRYIWPSFVLFTIIGFIIFNYHQEKFLKNTTRTKIATLLIIISFLPFFFYGLKQQLPTTNAYKQADSIKNKFGISGNFASTNYWDRGLALTYFLNSKFYGTEKLPIDSPKLLKKSQKLGINYILDYSISKNEVNGLEFLGEIDSIKIYKVTGDN